MQVKRVRGAKCEVVRLSMEGKTKEFIDITFSYVTARNAPLQAVLLRLDRKQVAALVEGLAVIAPPPAESAPSTKH